MYFNENRIVIAGEGKGNKGGRTPIEAPEGVYTGTNPTGIGLSKTQTKVLDLISEGEILGLATGKYIYSGILGNIGWSGVTFSANIPATGGNIRWLQSIYWNEIPIVDNKGLFNFQQVNVNYTKGSPNGTFVSDNIVDELTVSRPIQERLRGGGEIWAKKYRILDKNCIGSNINVKVGQLSKISTDKKTAGDTLITNINYTIYYRPVFSNRDGGDFILGKEVTILGKISAGYIQTTRIDFNNDYSNDTSCLGWEIKIVRWTEDSTSTTIRNQSFIDSLTEIYGSKFVYPNSAIVSSLFDAEYFSFIPNRTYEVELLKVKVPNNYNPIYKTYDESVPWSGLFKTDNNGNILKQWTDNPVWCFYDLLTNKRYGLGNYVDEDFIDKFTLYQISKYCDTLVSDGYGGLEPRFTCNLYLNSQEEAYRVVNAMASVFRAINYYAGGLIYTSIDNEKQPIYQFTNANVVDGDFVYTDRERKSRHTIATVRYNDKKNLYKPAIEYVEDIDSIRKYGIREIDLPVFGCTSRGQAIRFGRWALLTEGLETETISFKAGFEVAGFLRPGDIFQIYDSNKNINRLGGRVTNIVCSPTSTSISLDSAISGIAPNTNYKISLLTPTFYYDPSLVTGLDSNDVDNIRRSQIQSLNFTSNNISLNSSLNTNILINQPINYTDYYVSGHPVWLIEASGNNVAGNISTNEWRTYKTVNIKENESNIYEIHGIEYNSNKFLQIESGFNFSDTPINSDLQFASPENLKLTLQVPRPSPHSQLINYNFTISSITNIHSFKVLVKSSPFITNDENNENYVLAYLPSSTTNGTYLPNENGTYYFRVYSIGTNNVLSSNFAAGNITVTDVNPIQDVIISSLKLEEDSTTNSAGTISTGIYSSESPTFTWQIGVGTITNIPSDLSYRITVRPPTINNIPSQEIYFTESGYISQDSSYTFDFEDNYNSVSTLGKKGPFREYDIVVEAMTTGGYSSAGGTFDSNRNPIEDSNMYHNSNGYDILYANNPNPSAIPLWTGSTTSPVPGTIVPFYSTGRATQQWITSDGEIKIYFTNSGNITSLSGFFGDDIAGGTLYYSNNGIGNPTGWSNIQSTSDENPFIASVGLTNTTSTYIAIAPFDSFDVAYSNHINNYLVTGLDISNVVRITLNERKFIGPEMPLTNSSLIYHSAHGLNQIPTNVRWVLVCKSDDLNWSFGDEVDIFGFMNDNKFIPFTSFVDDTYVNLIMSYEPNIYLIAKTTQGSYTIGQHYFINKDNWRVKCYAS